MSLTFVLSRVVPIVVIVLLSMTITRIATIALTMTGVSRQSARFQARSALTGAGFTTSESESMVNHPVRRRIIMWLMLTGNAGIVSVVGLLFVTSSSRLTDSAAGPVVNYGLMVLGGVAVFWILGRPRVDKALSRIIRRGLRRYTDLEVRDYEAVLEISGGYAISEKLVKAGEWLAGKTLQDLQLSHEGVLVLGVQRHDGTYVGAPKGTIVVLPGDVLTMYGHQDRLADLDQRPAGVMGQDQHDKAVADQEAREQREQRDADRQAERDTTVG